MRPFAACFALLAACQAAPAQAQPARAALSDQPTVASVVDSLRALAASDASVRTARLDRFWTKLRNAGQVPFAVGDSLLWLYRGSASSVAWAGDHTGWSPTGYTGTNAFGLGVWMRRASFPADARIDYKVVLNGSNWVLDPANPFQQWSGFGPNTELRMPAYAAAPELTLRPGVARGAFSPNVRFSSAALGYDVQYRVWTPAGYTPASTSLPTLYVTDGHEFSDDRLGTMLVVLDNGIADGSIRPLVVVFVDPRNPSNTSTNRRQTELVPPGGAGSVCNPCRGDAFLTALASEVVPAIEAAYRVSASPNDRGILGTSLGGIFAAYAGSARPDVFRRIGILSPAFWAYPAIYDAYRRAPQGQTLFLAQGTIGDGDGGETLAPILQQNGYPATYQTRNQGHSWGQWRGLLPGLLRTLYGASTTGALPDARPTPALTAHVYPNPARGAATLELVLERPAVVTASVIDASGREVVQAWQDASLGAGQHRVRLSTRRWAAGRYVVQIRAGTQRLSVPLVVAR